MVRVQIVRGILAGVLVLLASVFSAEMVMEVRVDDVSGEHGAPAAAGSDIGEFPASECLKAERVAGVFRRGFFKPATPIADKPMADGTIERICSQLKLQCVVELGGEATAYIYVKGAGLKKCQAGDSVGEMFTVLEVKSGSVDLSVLEHKVTLSL